MKESDIYKALKKVWPYYIERIEPKYKGGIPDVLVENMGATFVELKLFEVQKNGTIKIKIRPSQYIWFRKYTGRALGICWDGDKYYVFNRAWFQQVKNGMSYDDFRYGASLVTDNIARVSTFIKLYS